MDIQVQCPNTSQVSSRNSQTRTEKDLDYDEGVADSFMIPEFSGSPVIPSSRKDSYQDDLLDRSRQGSVFKSFLSTHDTSVSPLSQTLPRPIITEESPIKQNLEQKVRLIEQQFSSTTKLRRKLVLDTPESEQRKKHSIDISNVTELVIMTNEMDALWCKKCKKHVESDVMYQNNVKTYMAATTICMLGGVCGCCVLPFCSNKCKQPVRVCSVCRDVI